MHYPPKKVYGFPTRNDLERLDYIGKARKSLASELINTKIAGRDYQIRSIRAVMEAVEKRKTKFLLVMATGTGKTRTCIALVDALVRGGWAERTLFLVDRIALRDQTLEAFKEHLPNEPRWPNQSENEIAADRRIYVSTYPTMLNVIRDENNPLSPHFFDLIVVDESHRSIYNTYKEILDYFNTITLGLPATPTDVIDRMNIIGYFKCDTCPTDAKYDQFRKSDMKFAFDKDIGVYNDYEVLVTYTPYEKENLDFNVAPMDNTRYVRQLRGPYNKSVRFYGTNMYSKNGKGAVKSDGNSFHGIDISGFDLDFNLQERVDLLRKVFGLGNEVRRYEKVSQDTTVERRYNGEHNYYRPGGRIVSIGHEYITETKVKGVIIKADTTREYE